MADYIRREDALFSLRKAERGGSMTALTRLERAYAEDFKAALHEVQPEISDVLVPNCIMTFTIILQLRWLPVWACL